jgi:hypothetical protein
MLSYDEVDKTNWVEMDLELDDDLAEKLKLIADEEQIELSDLISKFLYEWWQSEIHNANSMQKNDKIEVNQESKNEADNPTV